MSNKILTSLLIVGLASVTVFNFSIDFSQNYAAFAQTPDVSTDNPDVGSALGDTSTDPGSGPIPGDNSTDLGNGPIPEDNSTDLGNGPIPEDNSTNPSEINSISNQTDSGLPSPPAIPEFGSLAGMIITISVIGVIVATRRFLSHI